MSTKQNCANDFYKACENITTFHICPVNICCIKLKKFKLTNLSSPADITKNIKYNLKHILQSHGYLSQFENSKSSRPVYTARILII